MCAFLFDATGVFSKIKNKNKNKCNKLFTPSSKKIKTNKTNNMTENPHTALVFIMLQLYKLIRAYFPQEEKS